MYPLTIYTPTYNRASVLPRVYESLCRQTCKSFLWIVIDDGSTDETYELVKSWKNMNEIKIVYYYKENGGVHTARDLAYQKAETELILSIDSDDWLPDDAVENILEHWNKYGGEQYAGIIAPIISPEGNKLNYTFPNIEAASYQDFTYHHKYKGEKMTIIRTDIIKSIEKTPVFEGENLVGEGFKWIQLPKDKLFLLLNKPTRIADFQEDGYTKNARANFFKNPQGSRASHRKHIIHSKYWLPRFKGYIGYILFSLYLKDREFIKKSPNRLKTTLFVPLGFVAYIYTSLRVRIR